MGRTVQHWIGDGPRVSWALVGGLGAFSVLTVIAIFGFLLIVGLAACLAAIGTAVTNEGARSTRIALSIGLGLLVGPALFILLAGLVLVTN